MKIFYFLVSAIIFFLAIVSSESISGPGQDSEIFISVPGIPGPYCAYGLEKRLLEVPEIKEVDLLWSEEKIRIISKDRRKVSRSKIDEAIRKADYPYSYRILP